jgi:hypothetical protein
LKFQAFLYPSNTKSIKLVEGLAFEGATQRDGASPEQFFSRKICGPFKSYAEKEFLDEKKQYLLLPRNTTTS